MQEPREWMRAGFVLKPDTEQSGRRRGWLLELERGACGFGRWVVQRAAGESRKCLESVSFIDRVSKSESQDMRLTVARSYNRTSRKPAEWEGAI